MDAIEFIEFVEYAIEKEKKHEIKEQWNHLLPFMAMEMLKYIPFEKYYDQCTGRNIDMRPTDMIIAEIEALHKQEKGG